MVEKRIITLAPNSTSIALTIEGLSFISHISHIYMPVNGCLPPSGAISYRHSDPVIGNRPSPELLTELGASP